LTFGVNVVVLRIGSLSDRRWGGVIVETSSILQVWRNRDDWVPRRRYPPGSDVPRRYVPLETAMITR
jgi:hypothetical protein